MSNEASREAFEAWHSQRAAEIISKGKLIAQSMIEAGCTDSGPTHHNALLTALEQADGTGWDAWEASRKALEAEITRLQALIQKAQSESELIEYRGEPAIVVPYSFMRAATEMPEQAQAVEPVGYWLERAKELVEIFVEKPHDASSPAQQVAVPAGYVLVPVEPTPAILDAMSSSGWKTACYRAMIKAAAPLQGEKT